MIRCGLHCRTDGCNITNRSCLQVDPDLARMNCSLILEPHELLPGCCSSVSHHRKCSQIHV